MTRAMIPCPRRPGGFAIVAVLGVVLLLTLIVAFTLNITGAERAQAGKGVHNQTIMNATESALQYGKSYLLSKYPGKGWDTYLNWFVDHPAALGTSSDIASTLSAVQTLDANLLYTSGQYNCFIYARDDIDELNGVANDPRKDNNQLIFVGAVCTQTARFGRPLVAELSAPVSFISPGKY